MTFNGIGAMRWRVTLQARSAGAGPVSWSNTATVWAEVTAQPLKAERNATGTVVSTVEYLIRIRLGPDVSPTNRVLWNTKTLQVQAVRLLDTRYTELLCAELG